MVVPLLESSCCLFSEAVCSYAIDAFRLPVFEAVSLLSRPKKPFLPVARAAVWLRNPPSLVEAKIELSFTEIDVLRATAGPEWLIDEAAVGFEKFIGLLWLAEVEDAGGGG